MGTASVVVLHSHVLGLVIQPVLRDRIKAVRRSDVRQILVFDGIHESVGEMASIRRRGGHDTTVLLRVTCE
jgi:hypothetical protein